MSDSVFFEYFFDESRELLAEINSIASGLQQVDFPDARQQADFMQCVQKLHRLIGGMASIGFEMYAPVSHKSSLLALSCSSCSGQSIRDAVAAIHTIATDLSMYFISIDKVRDVEMLVSRIENKIESCMAGLQVQKATINSQSEIDDIMKMFGKV